MFKLLLIATFCLVGIQAAAISANDNPYLRPAPIEIPDELLQDGEVEEANPCEIVGEVPEVEEEEEVEIVPELPESEVEEEEEVEIVPEVPESEVEEEEEVEIVPEVPEIEVEEEEEDVNPCDPDNEQPEEEQSVEEEAVEPGPNPGPPIIAVQPPPIDPDFVPENVWITS